MRGDIKMKMDKLLYVDVKIDEKEVRASDLSTLVYFVEEISKAIAVSEAFDLLGFFNFPTPEKFQIVQRYQRQAEIPAKLEGLETGSAIVKVVISSSLFMWGLHTFLGKPIEEAWGSSNKREALVMYIQERFFSGAEKAVNQKLTEIHRKKNLIVSDVKVHSSRDQIQKIDIALKRTNIEVIKQTDEELISDFSKRLR